MKEPGAVVSIVDIHHSGYAGVLAVTGGGSLALSDLLTTPGASRSILEARVPYAETALAEWLGAKPAHACSQHTARAMAMAAFMRAWTLHPAGAPNGKSVGTAPSNGDDSAIEAAHDGRHPLWERLWGVACTASLATDRPKKGDHRFHVAWQTDICTEAFSVTLTKGARSRAEEERLVADCLLAAVARACRLGEASLPPLQENETCRIVQAVAEPDWRDVVLGVVDAACVLEASPATFQEPPATGHHPAHEQLGQPPIGSTVSQPPKPTLREERITSGLIFPGAFHPLHDGHRAMADWAERRLQRPVEFEISVLNVDKPPLDYVEIAERLAQFDRRHSVWLTRAATFVEKARIFPGATFLVGVDTIARIGEPRYYGSPEACRRAIGELVERGCRFLVFGRRVGEQFYTCDDVSLPAELRKLCETVPAGEFRLDISSTDIRAQQHVMED